MGLTWRILFVFLAVTGAVALGTSLFGLEFERANYWNYHGFFFLFAVSFFPRVTLVLSTLSGGLLWWLGWIFAPRLLVAVLATQVYWYENPVLVVIAWLIALGGESSEKIVMVRRSSRLRKGYDSAKWVDVESRN